MTMLLERIVDSCNVIHIHLAPHGEVSKGSKREFVDNDAIFKMKNAIDSHSEFQIAVVNFHKTGRVILTHLADIEPCFYHSDCFS